MTRTVPALSARHTEPSSPPRTRLGDYELVCLLAQGGMADIDLARRGAPPPRARRSPAPPRPPRRLAVEHHGRRVGSVKVIEFAIATSAASLHTTNTSIVRGKASYAIETLDGVVILE